MKNVEKLNFGARPGCFYWDYSLKDWSQEGCYYQGYPQSTRTRTVCQCSHLSSFSVLMDVTNQETPSTLKTVMTGVCSLLTIACLVASLYMAMFKNKDNYSMLNDQFRFKSNKFTLNLNILIWLGISHIIIIAGMDLTDYKVGTGKWAERPDSILFFNRFPASFHPLYYFSVCSQHSHSFSCKPSTCTWTSSTLFE